MYSSSATEENAPGTRFQIASTIRPAAEGIMPLAVISPNNGCMCAVLVVTSTYPGSA
jgi:hypothetical protein